MNSDIDLKKRKLLEILIFLILIKVADQKIQRDQKVGVKSWSLKGEVTSIVKKLTRDLKIPNSTYQSLPKITEKSPRPKSLKPLFYSPHPATCLQDQEFNLFSWFT